VGSVSKIPRRGDRHHSADRLDPIRGALIVDEAHQHFGRRSSSAWATCAALLDAQYGDTPYGARPFGEGLPHEIWKTVEDHDGDTCRAVYTATCPDVVYVLDVFMKKPRRTGNKRATVTVELVSGF
jgi:phage-related protein